MLVCNCVHPHLLCVIVNTVINTSSLFCHYPHRYLRQGRSMTSESHGIWLTSSVERTSLWAANWLNRLVINWIVLLLSSKMNIFIGYSEYTYFCAVGAGIRARWMDRAWGSHTPVKRTRVCSHRSWKPLNMFKQIKLNKLMSFLEFAGLANEHTGECISSAGTTSRQFK